MKPPLTSILNRVQVTW